VKRVFLRSVLLALVMAAAVSVIVEPPAFADAARGGKARATVPTRLWSAFPLNPSELPIQRTRAIGRSALQPPSPAEPRSPARSWLPMLILVAVSALIAALAVTALWPAVGIPRVRLQSSALERLASMLARERVSIVVLGFGLFALVAMEWLLFSG
jgi:sterol desaturase/sphingolipid hydroxylase (fatty acid hydroxylase superfamily)